MRTKFKYKQLLFLLADITIVISSYWLAALLRYEGGIPAEAVQRLWLGTSISIFAAVLLSVLFGCYDSLWQYAGFETIFRQGVVAALGTAALLIIKYSVFTGISGSIAVIYGIILFMLTSAIRTISRFAAWFRASYLLKQDDSARAVIIGAGDTGAMIIKRARDRQQGESFNPVAVIDKDAQKIGLKICGVKVVGDMNSIEWVCKTYRANEIIVAIPNAEQNELYEIYRQCIKTNLPIRSFQNLMDVKDYIHKDVKDKFALKNVTIEDLLFRDVVKNDMTAAREFIQGRVVMVTGGAGSIGSELCKQALEFGCELLIVYDFNENGLYAIDEGLNGQFAGFDKNRYKLCLGSIRDVGRLNDVIKQYKPYVVFHAAAHKHVPMMELNPFEAVKNNVTGTKNTVEACIQNGVKKFILISTDKAVNSVNIMGASKRLAELVLRSMGGRGTELAAVRFGNVLGSAGSVIPKWKRQISEGGPVSLTHKEMVRYFMTIPEAVGLVMTAGALAKGGEIFVLDMGRLIKMYDLATDLIRLSGYEPEVDIKIKETGIRPGEKLFEELFLSDETVDKTTHEKIFMLKSDDSDNGDNSDNVENFTHRLADIIKIAKEEQDEETLRKSIFGLVNKNNKNQDANNIPNISGILQSEADVHELKDQSVSI
jgi:FlaA1/EpsC-like NDP-sugar epimerase